MSDGDMMSPYLSPLTSYLSPPELTAIPITQEQAMRRFPSWLVPTLALAAACGKPADKPAEAPKADTSVTAAPAAPASPQAIVTIIYNQPKNVAAFEKYYHET